MTTNDCKGCKAYDTRTGTCCAHAFNGGTCPCAICIIKMVCVETCDAFDKYVAKKERKLMVEQGDDYDDY